MENPGTGSGDNDANHLSNMRLNDHKAGMQGLDVDKINDIIEKASKGSKFYEHKKKSQERIDKKVAEMKVAMAKVMPEQRKAALAKMDLLAEELERSRDLSRTIVHVDMDAFYAAVEMRDNPALRDKPMAVGSNSMLSTSNYAARKYGVRAAMPGFIGRKLCPNLIIVPPDFSKYEAVSDQVRQVFFEYDPEHVSVSLDEAYLDLTDCLQWRREAGLESDPEKVVGELRAKIEERTKLTASAGIATNTMLAKVCSERNKPNGHWMLKPSREAITQLLGTLPVRKVSGIGGVTEQLLSGALGVRTCTDLWKQRDLLPLLFSDNSCRQFLCVSLGLGSHHLKDWSVSERKSVSCETTFAATSCRRTLLDICRSLSCDLAADLESKKLSGRSITLKYKTAEFDLRTRTCPVLSTRTRDSGTIASAACECLTSEMNNSVAGKPLTLRLLGVRMAHFGDGGAAPPKKVAQQQLTLDQMFGAAPPKRRRTVSPSPESYQGAPSDSAGSGPSKYRRPRECAESLGADVIGAASSSSSQPESSSSVGGQFTCPVCLRWSTNDAEVQLNRHMDECLNQQTIQAMTTEQTPSQSRSSYV